MRIVRPTLEHAFAAALEDAQREKAAAAPLTHAADKDAALMQALEALLEAPDDAPERTPPSAPYREELAAGESAAAREKSAPPPTQPAASRPLRTGSAHELSRERRRLALDNHPDRVPPEEREAASRAMAEINAAIDQALKALKKARPL